METYYLVDFENVHNEGVEHISSLSKDDHILIFYTKNALNISLDIAFAKDMDIEGHRVPEGAQSLDKHLITYLGYLVGCKGSNCSIVIISKDKGFDKIIKFWNEKGYQNISRKTAIPKAKNNKSTTVKEVAKNVNQNPVSINSKISTGMAYDFSGDDRSDLNIFMQKELANLKYNNKTVNAICKCVIAHCNDEKILLGIHNELKILFDDYTEVYSDVKKVLDDYVSLKGKDSKRESQIRSMYGQHFKTKEYSAKKEDTINILLKTKTRQGINNELLKLYGNSDRVKALLKVYQPIIKDLPGK